MTERSSDSAAIRPALLERIGAFFFAWRNGVFTLVLVLLLLAFPPVPAFGSHRADAWLDLVGFAIALAGQCLRFAVIGYAYIRRGGRGGKVYADRLVTAGFFRHSRNPLYLGNLLVMAGLFVVHNNPWVYALGIPFFLFAYAAIVAAEEAYLSRQFGAEYQDYCRRVPRWLPDFRGLRQSVAGMEFDWRRVIVKEYGSTYAWTAGMLLLLTYEALREPPSPQRNIHVLTLLGMTAVLTAVWLGVRYLKLSRRLRPRHDL